MYITLLPRHAIGMIKFGNQLSNRDISTSLADEVVLDNYPGV